ncbi:hypothetical protein [Avrilella dinanensis]|uniref:hypothetical protein n=1 Tax=Avrilella dinanensis TaxID=2008672 RepID=UPI00240A7668|nr:hypothetical protein [Avrilella dinanensis]
MQKIKKFGLGIFLVSALSFTLWSCSSDENIKASENTEETNQNIMSVTSNSNNPSIENEIDQMFYEYVNSDIYIEVRGLLYDFNDDLNYDGNIEDINTESKLFDWIENNIRTTKFESVSDAQNKWEHLGQKLKVEISTFNLIYQYIVSTPISEVEVVIHKWLIPNSTFSDRDICRERFKACNMEAAGKFAIASLNALNLTTGLADYKKQQAALNTFINNTQTCASNYKKCRGL